LKAEKRAMEALPLKSALAGRSYGSVAKVSRKKQLTLRLRLRSVITSAVFAILFAGLIGVCLTQIFTNELKLTPVHQIENLDADGSNAVYNHLIHLYHNGRRDDTNYQGDCTTVEHDGHVGVKECFLKCKSDRGCKSFIYDIKSKKCCGSTSYEPGYPIAGHTNWYQMQVFGPECKPLKVFSNSMRQVNKVPAGWSDVSSALKGCVRTKTLEECLGKCVSSDGCVAFNYARSGGMCCGSTSEVQGVLGMGVDFLVLPKDAGKVYNPEQDCYHQNTKDVTVGGTASLTDLFSGKALSADTTPSDPDAAASVQGVVNRVADSAKDAAKDAGSLNEFMKELFPEKFGLKVGASSVNVGDISAAPVVATPGIQPSAPAAYSGGPPAMAGYAPAAPALRRDYPAASAAPTRHVHGAPLPPGTRPLLFSPPSPTSTLPGSMSSPPVPMLNGGAVRSSSIPLVPSFGHETSAMMTSSLSSSSSPTNMMNTNTLPISAEGYYSAPSAGAAALPLLSIPNDPQDALAQAQEILIVAEKRAAEFASASGVPKAPDNADMAVSSEGHPQAHRIKRH